MSVGVPDQGLLTTVQPNGGWRQAPSQAGAPRHLRRSRQGDWWGLLLLFAVSAALSVAYGWGGLAHPTTAISSNPGDSQEVIWTLSWVQFSVFHGHSGLFSDYALYPAGVNLLSNAQVWLPAVVVSPLTWLAGPVLSYNVLYAATPVVAACTSYLLFLRYLETRVGAMLGALTFAFSPFLVYQTQGHQQLSLLGLMPLILIVLDEILVRQRWRWWVAGSTLGALAAAQFVTGEELLVIVGLLGAAIVVLTAVLHPGQVARKAGYVLRTVPMALGVFVALAAYPLYVQYAGPQHSDVVHGAGGYSTDLANLIQPVHDIFDPKLASNVASFHEPTGYLGIPLLVTVAVAAALTLRRRPVVPVALAVLLVFLALTMGPVLRINGHTYGPWVWTLFDHGPLQQLLPCRLIVVVDLLATFFLGVFIDVVVARGPRLGRVLGGGLVLLVVLSWVPRSPSVSSAQSPPFFTSSAKEVIPQGSVALVLPYVHPVYERTALRWQAASGMRFRMVEGWFIVPGPHNGPVTTLSQTMIKLQTAPVAVTPALAAAVRADLAGDRVQEVIVGPGPAPGSQARTIRFFVSLFGRQPDLESGGVALWWVNRA